MRKEGNVARIRELPLNRIFRKTGKKEILSLRKALTSGVSKAVAKDTRVSAVEEAYVRLEKGIGSLVWMLDNCEATWSAQAAFTKYLPIIASDIYSRSDPVAKDVISATSKLAGELAIASSNTAVFAPIRSELAALKERVAKLRRKRTLKRRSGRSSRRRKLMTISTS